MASSQYDLDTSGGLMPQIQALLAPPSLEDIAKEKKRDGLALHPYYKRPGRGHNRDSCDACKEGGGLICCDSCPASFHLQCHDPPLEESDLPRGLWHCHSCRIRMNKGESAAQIRGSAMDSLNESESIRNGKLMKHAFGSVDKFKQSSVGRPEGVLKRRGTNTSDETEGEPPIKIDKTDDEENMEDSAQKGSLLGSLIKVAASMNPQQFELPTELVEPIAFPGTSKSCNKKSGNGTKKKSYELDNGLVPLPIRPCFYCSKSCRKAPMVACDFCPLVFHLDCLDPPLVCMPVGKWMCPNHPENMEYKLLSDSRLTERIKFWSMLQRPIDPETVKLNFLRKVHRKNPPFRRKILLPSRPRMKVPQIIKDQYRHPPLLPQRSVGSQPFFWSSILPDTRQTTISEPTDMNPSDSEETHNLETILESSNATLTEKNSRINERLDTSDTLSCGSQDVQTEKSLLNQSECDEDFNQREQEVKNYLASLKRNVKERNLKVFMEKLSNDLLSSMDSEMLRLLAMQRVQELILNPESRSLTIFPYPGYFTSSSNNTSNNCGGTLPWIQSRKHLDSDNNQPNTFPRQPRAFLCPLDPAYPPSPLYNRNLTIGTGANMDLTLSSFGSCNYVSGHHSTIFYDEMSKHFELLNYSEHGTVVDNIVYCCDLSADGTLKTSEDTKEKGKKSTASSLDDANRLSAGDASTSGNKFYSEIKEVVRCGCRTGSCSIGSAGENGKSGWEGTALLTHGSHIKFGCLQFILCISNTNEKPRFIHH